ncbi:fluoride efflux transporter CrcB [Erythrobacter sp. MTPC3]|uniref:fluoride efflux transporter CrcB n=1 Tax=Erythrobacter sp. MTPC3 TaxID=3056564 RepID=UPI0036F1D755
MTTATLSPLAATALVAVGGAAGSAMRYQIGGALASLGSAERGFPWAILSVNVIGSLAMGILFGWLARQGGGTETMRLLLGVGLLGGFTTFSAFSLEIVLLIQRGDVALACVYAGASVIAGIIALYLGLILMGDAA